MDVQAKVIEAVTKVLRNREVIKDSEVATPESNLAEIESLDRVEVVVAVEEAFDLEYTKQADIDKMETVQDVIRFVERATGQPPVIQ
jgi:acyl carrier protein